MRTAFLVAAVVGWAIGLGAQAGVRAEPNSAVEAQIKGLELKQAELVVRGDWEEYAKRLASDFTRTRENGQMENRAEALASLSDAKRKIIVMEMEPSGISVRLYGQTAVVNAEFSFTVRDSGQIRNRRSRLSDVWVKSDGEWWLVAEQDTTIGK
jgi:hypothetical protein